MEREIDAAFTDMVEIAARSWRLYLAAASDNATIADAGAKEAHLLSMVLPAMGDGLAQQRLIAELYGIDEDLVRRDVENAAWRSWAESEREARRWKRKYFSVRRLAARLARELRKFSPASAEIAERKLAAAAGIEKGGDSE